MLAHEQTHTNRDLSDPSVRSAAREGSWRIDDDFVLEHRPFVRRCLARFGITGADLDDAVQDVFLVALGHSGHFDVTRSPRPWLYTVALNVSRNARRKRQRVETPMAEPPEIVMAPRQEQQLHAHEARSLVHRALDELPPAQRDVVLLHRLEGWPMDVVAETVGCPVATAHSRLRLGTARLDRAVRKQVLRARCAALLAAFLGAFASPPVAAAATAAVVLVVIGAVVVIPRREPAPQEEVAPGHRSTPARTSPPPSEENAADDVTAEASSPPLDEPPRAARPEGPAAASRPTLASAPVARHVASSSSPASASPATPSPTSAAVEPPEDALVQETRMLARARALVSTSPVAARQALDAYDSRFPQGQLHRERAAIERALAVPQ